MFAKYRIYGRVGISSPAWPVERISRRAYIECFSKYGKVHNFGRILDIGCGNCEKRAILPEDVEYVGLDHPGCPHDKSKIQIFATAYETTLDDNSFDTILCTNVLEHLEEPAKAIAEAYRVLKPGGYAIYGIPQCWHLHEEPRDFYRYTKWGIKYLFENAGFEIVELRPLSGFWITMGTEWNYYLLRFAVGPFKYFVRAITALGNLVMSKLDRGFLRDERFTWEYVVVARKREECPK